MDILTPSERSVRMGLIRSRNTKPEMRVRQIVYGMGYRYRLHVRDLPGTPDLVFKSRRKVLFVHGCFWHLHQNCHRYRVPRSRLDYWRPKLEGNVARDKKIRARLSRLGWRSLVIWECETEDAARLAAKIAKFLQ